MSIHSTSSKRAFTLFELLMVLAIVALVATLAAGRYGGLGEDARQDACRHDLATLREAVCRLVADMEGVPNFHKVNPLWEHPVYDTNMSVSVHLLFAPTNYYGNPRTGHMNVDISAWRAAGLGFVPKACTEYDSVACRGWRGPYLAACQAVTNAVTGRYELQDPWGTPYRIQVPHPDKCRTGSDRFPMMWLPAGPDAAVSAVFAERRWQFARIVSAGPDGVFQTESDGKPDVFAGLKQDGTFLARGDDLVLYLNRPDVWENLEREVGE